VSVSKRRSFRLCLFLIALWSLLGAGECACYFVVARLPAPGGGLPDSPFSLLLIFGGAVMVPACLVLPVALQLAGRRCLYIATTTKLLLQENPLARAAASPRWLTWWTAAVQASMVVEAYFILRLHWWYLGVRTGNTFTSWHALEFSIAFLIAGAAMASTLIHAARRLNTPVKA
jgi:hypothetical protein